MAVTGHRYAARLMLQRAGEPSAEYLSWLKITGSGSSVPLTSGFVTCRERVWH